MEHPRRLLLCGTNTEVGKTHVGAALARALTERGVKVAVYKPLESGAQVDDDDTRLEPTDARTLREAAGSWQPMTSVCPWPLPRPVTPAEELARLGLKVTQDEIREGCVSAEDHADLTLIETAGGLRSPLTDELTSMDLATLLSARPILVSANRLGCINATSLSLSALENAGTPALAVLLNTFGHDDGPDRASNHRWIAHLHPGTPIINVGPGPELPAELVELVMPSA